MPTAVVPVAPGTAGTILPNALRAGHDLVLALDRALPPAGSPVRVMIPEVLLKFHPERHDRNRQFTGDGPRPRLQVKKSAIRSILLPWHSASRAMRRTGSLGNWPQRPARR